MTDTANNEQIILDTMKKAGKPMRPGEIATNAGLEKDIVSKTIKNLKKKGLVNSPKQCFYSPVE